VGLKVTRILQLLPGASIVVEHCVETLNTGLSVVAVPIVTIAPSFLPAFFTVALFGLLVAPTLVDLPKLNCFGSECVAGSGEVESAESFVARRAARVEFEDSRVGRVGQVEVVGRIDRDTARSTRPGDAAVAAERPIRVRISGAGLAAVRVKRRVVFVDQLRVVVRDVQIPLWRGAPARSSPGKKMAAQNPGSWTLPRGRRDGLRDLVDDSSRLAQASRRQRVTP
jgi:hypothetical protein